ncbi:MAG: hypothetical protein R3F59_18465 [Myxococcota bacterium]
MHHRAILQRLRTLLREGTYLVPTRGVPPRQREALDDIAQRMAAPGADPDAIRARIEQLRAAGAIDGVVALSALGVLAASPLVRDYAEASRLAGEQELAALQAGGPWRDAQLASADRHRGVIAYLLGHDVVALDWFTRALGRERSAENLGNVLAVLLRLGEEEEARRMVAVMGRVLAPADQEELGARIRDDDDLVRLRAAAD